MTETVVGRGVLNRPAAPFVAIGLEDRYDTSTDDLWSALTDPQRLARWVAEVKR